MNNVLPSEAVHTVRLFVKGGVGKVARLVCLSLVFIHNKYAEKKVKSISGAAVFDIHGLSAR